MILITLAIGFLLPLAISYYARRDLDRDDTGEAFTTAQARLRDQQVHAEGYVTGF